MATDVSEQWFVTIIKVKVKARIVFFQNTGT
jgi:hypothetical protein